MNISGKYIIILVFFAFFSSAVLAQNMNNVKNNLSENKLDDTAKISYIINKAKILHKESKFSECIRIIKNAIEISVRNDNYKLSECWFILGEANAYGGTLSDALKSYRNAERNIKNKKSSLYIDILKGIAGVMMDMGEYNEALKLNLQALKLAKDISDIRREADNTKNIGMIYSALDKQKEALIFYNKALVLFDILKNDEGQIKCLINIAYTYLAKENIDSSIINSKSALNLLKRNDFPILEGACYTQLGEIYSKNNNIDSAFDYHTKAYEVYTGLSYKNGQVYSLNSLGDLSISINDTAKAHKYYKECYEISYKYKLRPELNTSYRNLAELYEKENDYKKAYTFLENYLYLNDSIIRENTGRQIEETYAEFENQENKQQIKVFEEYKRYGIIVLVVIVAFIIVLLVFFQKKNSAYNQIKRQQEENMVLLEKLQHQKDETKIQAEKLSLINDELQKLSLVAKKTDNAVLIADENFELEWVNGAFTDMFGYNSSELRFKNYEDENLMKLASTFNEGLKLCRLKNKSVQLSSNLSDKSGDKHWFQTTYSPIYNTKGQIRNYVAISSDITQIKLAEMEIKFQHDEIELQRDQIAIKNEEIKDSITYAQRIQHAVMPQESYFENLFKHYFIIYKPKDIVSGDFYWVAKKENKKIIAVADCTGHGVPGAFMSMLGSVLLNEIVNKHQELGRDFSLNAAKILNLLRLKLKSTLHQTGERAAANDGMDIAVCIIDEKKNMLEFSGANLPLYLIRKKELKKIPGDRMPIGVYTESDTNFTNNEYKIDSGDMIYMSSDGYVDQFGGPNGKKFLSKNFRDLLVNVSENTCEEQKMIISDIFDGWKGELEQTDDVLVVGIKIA